MQFEKILQIQNDLIHSIKDIVDLLTEGKGRISSREDYEEKLNKLNMKKESESQELTEFIVFDKNDDEKYNILKPLMDCVFSYLNNTNIIKDIIYLNTRRIVLPKDYLIVITKLCDTPGEHIACDTIYGDFVFDLDIKEYPKSEDCEKAKLNLINEWSLNGQMEILLILIDLLTNSLKYKLDSELFYRKMIIKFNQEGIGAKDLLLSPQRKDYLFEEQLKEMYIGDPKEPPTRIEVPMSYDLLDIFNMLDRKYIGSVTWNKRW